MWDQFLSRLNSFDPGVLKSFFLTIETREVDENDESETN